MNQFELSILDWIQTHLTFGIGDAVMPAISFLADNAWFWILLSLVLLAVPKTRRLGLTVAISLILMLILCNLTLKPLIMRTRPYVLNPDMPLITHTPSDSSFPSGHTASSFAAASALFFSKSRLRIPAIVLAVLIGLSRMYLYMHFPTDVLAGALLGILCGKLSSIIVSKIRPNE